MFVKASFSHLPLSLPLSFPPKGRSFKNTNEECSIGRPIKRHIGLRYTWLLLSQLSQHSVWYYLGFTWSGCSLHKLKFFHIWIISWGILRIVCLTLRSPKIVKIYSIAVFRWCGLWLSRHVYWLVSFALKEQIKM